MGISALFDLDGSYEALASEGRSLMRECAARCQEAAQRAAPVDTGNLRRQIVLGLLPDGAEVISRVPYSLFVEFGTGVYGEPQTAPHRNTPWVYYDARRKAFFTTSGARARPYMRPGYDAGREHFRRERRRRGL